MNPDQIGVAGKFMGFIKNFFNFILHPTSSRTTGILIILVLAATVPLTVLVAQKQQELRQHAEGTNCTVTVNLPSGNPPWTIGYLSGATPISTADVPNSYTFYNVASGQYSFTVTDGDLQTSTITANADCPATTPTLAPTTQTTTTPIPTTFPCSGGLLSFTCFSGSCPADWLSASQNPNTTCATSGQTCCWRTSPSGCTATNSSDCLKINGCTWYNNSYCDKSTIQPTPTPIPFNCSQPGYGCYPSSDSPNGVPLAPGYTTTCDTPNTGLGCYQLVSTPTLPPIPPTSTPIPTAQTIPPVQQNTPPTQPQSTAPPSTLPGDFDINGCIGKGDFGAWNKAYSNNVPMPNGKIPTLLDFNVWYNAMLTTPKDKLCKEG